MNSYPLVGEKDLHQQMSHVPSTIYRCIDTDTPTNQGWVPISNT